MGTITITATGSFKATSRTFRAINYGHANAVAMAIEWLAADILPIATAKDHELHTDNAFPIKGFDRQKHIKNKSG